MMFGLKTSVCLCRGCVCVISPDVSVQYCFNYYLTTTNIMIIMNRPKCLSSSLVIVFLVVGFILLDCLVPCEAKVKKIKAMKKLIKAKLLLKPLLKAGAFKLPMVHFVIPIQKPGGFQNNGFASNLLGGLGGGKQALPNNNYQRVRCRPKPYPQHDHQQVPNYPIPRPTIQIPGSGCRDGNSGSGGGLFGSSGFPMNIDFGSLPRINLAGLFGGVSGSDCKQTHRPSKVK